MNDYFEMEIIVFSEIAQTGTQRMNKLANVMI